MNRSEFLFSCTASYLGIPKEELFRAILQKAHVQYKDLYREMMVHLYKKFFCGTELDTDPQEFFSLGWNLNQLYLIGSKNRKRIKKGDRFLEYIEKAFLLKYPGFAVKCQL